jgi:predicted alpha-1,6-mannanase (GH76 family)
MFFSRPSIFVPVLLLMLLTPVHATSASILPGADDDSARQVQAAVVRLQEWYNPQTGLWNQRGWWHDANALTAVIDFSRATNSIEYLPVIARTYAANVQSRVLINKFYDDEGWWALAWIDAYDLTGNPDYLHAAGVIFDDMTSGWDNACGGGIWWTRDRDYKNAIANELFLSVAAHLANRATIPAQQAGYVTWAQREWKWFQHTGMIERDHLISDGLDAQCQDNHKTKWTYNQGVVLGALAELSRLPGQTEVLHDAHLIADAAVLQLTDTNGVLHESCEPKCSGDGAQFKGIFVRNLAELNARSPDSRYTKFMVANAESLLNHSQGPDHSFGVVWSGPPGIPTSISQTSAVEALVAALGARGKGNK